MPSCPAPYCNIIMDALFVSTGIVALAEMGDKTQLLALILAAKFRKPWPIIWGILAATLLNHGMAGAVGTWLTSLFTPETLRWVLGLSFIGMAVWMLIPDRFDESEARLTQQWGVFGTTFVAFFLAEMGDKTQIATVALAAQYQTLTAVVVGTTLGMMVANVPAVVLGNRMAHRLPIRLIHAIAASIFLVLGALTLAGMGASWGLGHHHSFNQSVIAQNDAGEEPFFQRVSGLGASCQQGSGVGVEHHKIGLGPDLQIADHAV